MTATTPDGRHLGGPRAGGRAGLLHGEVLLRAGRPAEAETVFADACWVALTGRGPASARARLGDPAGAAAVLRATGWGWASSPSAPPASSG